MISLWRGRSSVAIPSTLLLGAALAAGARTWHQPAGPSTRAIVDATATSCPAAVGRDMFVLDGARTIDRWTIRRLRHAITSEDACHAR